MWGRNDSVRATKRRGIAILDGGGRRCGLGLVTSRAEF